MNSWGRIGSSLARRTVAALIGVALVTAVLAIGLGKLDFATGQDSYMDPSSVVAQNNTRYQELFGGENMVVLLTTKDGSTVADLFAAGNRAALESIGNDLSTSSAVQSVISPIDLLQWTQDLVDKGVATNVLLRTAKRDPDAASQALRSTDLAINTLRLAAAGAHNLDNPEWVEFLLYGNDGYTLDGGKLVAPPDDQRVIRKSLRAFIPDQHHAILAGVLAGNASLDELAAGAAAVKAAVAKVSFSGVSVVTTGTPTFLTDINDYLQGGMAILGAVAVLVMMVILLVAFRVRWRLLPLAGMAVGVAWGFGLFGFTGTKLSLVTIAGLPILIGLGIEFAIQVQNRIEEERGLDHERDPFGETLAHIGPPLLAATVAAAIAFLVVKISKVPMVQDFGVLLTLGIVALLVAGIVLPIALIGARERRSASTREPTLSWVERTVARLGALPRRTVLPLVMIAVGIPVLGLVLEGGTHIESDPIKWANPDSTSVRDVRTLERETGFASTLGVFIETGAGDAAGGGRPTVSPVANGVFTDQMGAFVFGLVERSLAAHPELAQASSLATTIGWAAEVPGATVLPPTGLDMLEAYQVAPAVLQRSLVAANGGTAQILFQVGPSSLEERAKVVKALERDIADPAGDAAVLPARSQATAGGLAVVGVGLLENITANRAELTIVALLLVGAFVILRYRDLGRGLITMVPVLLAVGASAVLVRLLGVTLSPLTTVGGPLVVATCAEFCILLVDRYAEERRRGLSPEQGYRVAAERTGRAFFVSALTTLGGFAVLMFSSLPLLADFGLVVTINIAVALLAALVVVPPLVQEADRRGLLSWSAQRSGTRSTTGRVAALVAGGVLGVVGIGMAIRATQDDTVAVAR